MICKYNKYKALAAVIVLFAALAISAQKTEKTQKDDQLQKPLASPAPTSPARKSFAEIVNAPVVYTIAGMERTIVKKDLVYKSEQNVSLKLDVYLPPTRSAKKEKRPIVFFIHGGTPLEARPKDWGVFASWGKLAAASGMIGVVFTHRMNFPKPELALAETDLTDAVAYMRANAGKFGADETLIALVSFSAGGPLLSVPLRTREKWPFVRALAAFYSFLDIEQSEMHQKQIGNAEILKKYSVINHLQKDEKNALPPILVARAGLDRIPGLNDATDRFAAAALANNISLEILNHPAGVHGFDNQTDDARSKEIIRRALEFLKTNLLR